MSERPLTFTHRYVAGSGANARTTLFLLHGTGGDENDLLELGRELLPGAAILSPRGKVLENGMPRFFRRLAEGVFDFEDLERRTHELASFLDEACKAYSLDRTRLIAVGYSNGANIAASLLLLRPEQLPAAVLFRAMVPLVPMTMPNLQGKSVLIAAGQADPIANAGQTRRLLEMLSKAGADVTVHNHPGGHELGRDDVEVAKTWLSTGSFGNHA